jgi:hypothetical protein
MMEKPAHLMAVRKQRETDRSQSQDIPFKGTLPVTHFLQPGPTFHRSTVSQ